MRLSIGENFFARVCPLEDVVSPSIVAIRRAPSDWNKATFEGSELLSLYLQLYGEGAAPGMGCARDGKLREL